MIRTNSTVFFISYILLCLSNSLGGSVYLIANDISTPENKTKVVGLLGTINGIAMVGGIFIGGLVTDLFGTFAIFYMYAIMLVPGLILIPIFFKNKKNDKKTPLLPFFLLKSKQLVFSALFYLMIPAFVYITSTGLSLFGRISLGLSSSVTGTLALPKNIIFIFLPSILGSWMSKKLEAYGKVVYICGAAITLGSIICCFWNCSTPIWVIYLTMVIFGIGTSCQSVFLYSYYPFFVPHENLGGANSLIELAACTSKYAYTAIYQLIYNRNYDAYTADGGQGLGELVHISFRGGCIASVITGICILLMRTFMYTSPADSKKIREKENK